MKLPLYSRRCDNFSDEINTLDPVATPGDIAKIKSRWTLAFCVLTLSIAILVAAGTTLSAWIPHDSQRLEKLR